MQCWISSVLLLTFHRVKIGWSVFHQYLDIFHCGKGVHYLTYLSNFKEFTAVNFGAQFPQPVMRGTLSHQQIAVDTRSQWLQILLSFFFFFGFLVRIKRDLWVRSQTEAPEGDMQLAERPAFMSVSFGSRLLLSSLVTPILCRQQLHNRDQCSRKCSRMEKKTTLLSWAWAKRAAVPGSWHSGLRWMTSS